MRLRQALLCATVLVGLSAPARAAEPAPTAGWLIPPVDGAIARRYLEPPGRFAAGHRGIDYVVPSGTLVRAAADGRVTYAGPVAGMHAVSIDHGDGVTTTYSSVASWLVETTDQVRQGQWIARVGVPHEGGAPGLHFGVKLNGDYVDPFTYLGPVGLAGAIHLAPVVVPPPEVIPGDFRSALDVAAQSEPICGRPAPIVDPPPPNGNIAVAIAGISGTSDGAPPDLYVRGPRLLGYHPGSIYRFSYEGASGPSLHEPYDVTATFRDLRDAARRLREQLMRVARRAPGRSVDLIAHSQGGIVARIYLETLHRSWDPRLPVIDHLVTFATPHEGAPLAGISGPLERDTLTGGPLIRWMSRRAQDGAPWADPLSDSARQLAPGSPLLESLSQEDLSFGTRSLALGIANDAIVPADRARFDNEASAIVGPSGFDGHSAILSDGDSLATAYAFLRDALPACPTGWDAWGGRIGAGIGWLQGRVPWAYGLAEQALLRRALVKMQARARKVEAPSAGGMGG